MRHATPLALIAFSLVLGSTPAAPPKPKQAPLDLKGKTLKQLFNDLLPGMGVPDLAARKDPQQAWQALCIRAGAPGNETLRKEVCALMIEKLSPKTPAPAREWLLHQLQQIGRKESVGAVAALLADSDDHIRDAAIRCLAANPAPEATAKLLARVSSGSTADRIVLLNAVGYRADAAAIPVLRKELANQEASVAVAAARALGKIGTPAAAEALAAELPKATDPVLAALTDAWLQCADRRFQEGKTAMAAAIYREANSPAVPRYLRSVAVRGVLKSSGEQAGTMVLNLVGAGDPAIRALAIGQIADLNTRALKIVAEGLSRLPPMDQAMVLNALAARGDRSMLPAALGAVKSQNERVREAGLLALGRLGDSSVVPLLLDTLFTHPKLAGAARDSLGALTGTEVDKELLTRLEAEKDSGKRGDLIAILETRKVIATVPALLQFARGGDAALRSRGLAALRTLAAPPDVPEMVKVLLHAGKGRERDEAAQAVAAVCARIAEPGRRAEPVLAVYRGAGKVDQIALLPLLGRIGGPDALEAARAALANGDVELAEAGRQALCGWPDVSASRDLLRLAQNGGDERQRKEALLALIRVNTVLDEGTKAERLASLKKAMELAPGTAERQKVLGGLATVRHIEALRFVLPYLDDKELAQQACRTIVELAHSQNLREPNRALFVPALDRVIALCRDAALVERAKRYKEGR